MNTLNMSRAEWLEARRSGIGGSDAGAIFGVNPYASRISVYLDKVGEGAERDESEFDVGGSSEAAYWGTRLEEMVAREFSRQTGKKVRRVNRILRHPEHEFMFANLDRVVVGERAIVECKTASAYSAHLWEDGIPQSYYLQVQHYLAVTGYERAYVPVLLGGQKFKVETVERDEALIEELIAEESVFWNEYVVPRIMPDFREFELTGVTVGRAFGDPAKAQQDVVELGPEADEIILSLNGLKESAKILKEKIDREEAYLKALLGDNEFGTTGTFNVSWKWSKPSLVADTDKLKADGLFEKYAKKRAGSRRFTVSEVKGEKK